MIRIDLEVRAIKGIQVIGRCCVMIATILLVALSAQYRIQANEPAKGRQEVPKVIPAGKANSSLALAHYMPWFVAKPISPVWGWHWTMNQANPDRMIDGKVEIASHFHPLIGPYDSGDPHVLEYHLLLMKIAGIDGVIVDWYGLKNFRDYAILHRNTQKLIELVEKLGMRFAICYEDQTIPALVKENLLDNSSRVSHAVAEIKWMAENWFSSNCYVKIDGRPLLLSFGQDGLTDDEWSAALAEQSRPISYFSLHNRRRAAIGAFDWPLPNQGIESIEQFQLKSREWVSAIPVAFPRFRDYYADAKIHESWGSIDDRDGQTLKSTLDKASSNSVFQIATWNDWGEGTQIEPSVEMEYRDLELVQTARKANIAIDLKFAPQDLKLPARLLACRRKQGLGKAQSQMLDEASRLLAIGAVQKAIQLLGSIE